MTTNRPEKRRIDLSLLTMITMLLAVVHSVGLQSRTAQAADLAPDSYRFGIAVDNFDHVRQYAVAYDLVSPRVLRASRLELSTGIFKARDRSRPFVSLGLVWQYPLLADRFYLEAGIGPTLLAGSSLDGHDLGGSFHFTSAASAGMRFGRFRRNSVALRIQHTSNGGLQGTNPGLDIVALNISYHFDN